MDHPLLADKISKRSCGIESSAGGECLFPAHYTPSQIHEGVRNNTLKIGTFIASRENFLEGSVNVENPDLMVCKGGICLKF